MTDVVCALDRLDAEPVHLSGFEKHNIKHTSASQINMYADAPCAWVAQYLFGRKGKFGGAAKAGLLVEEALVNVLMRGMTEESAISHAVHQYNIFTAIGSTDSELKRGEGIPEMIRLALEELKQYGDPEFDRDGITGELKQKKVEVTCHGVSWALPIIGYIDFHFPKHGLIIDLKTTTRMPSEMSDAHLRQQAIYRQAFGNQAVKFLYVTPKKKAILEPDSHTPALESIKTILTRQEKFLSLGDKEFLRSFVPVNAESFYWNGNADTRRELYGL